MDAHDVPDSTDWLNTPLSGLAPLENALHCQICKEFFDTPMITSCSHTFCSKCIRTALSTDGCCPACRTQDQASKLRNNWQLQEVLVTFLEARPETIRIAREQRLATTDRPGKRKRIVLDSDNGDPEEPVGRTTRSKSRRVASSQASHTEVIELEDDADRIVVDEEPVLDDGLVECPLGCGQRMKIEQVEPHLDRCEDERRARDKTAELKRRPPVSRPQDRLNELNYSMMKEKDLSKKLRDLGISTYGSKQLMVRRHTAWVNIWNANCDSSSPRNKRDLVRELEIWERAHGWNASTATNSIMKKDFDGAAWIKDNQNDFSRLIADARRSKTKQSQQSEVEKVSKTKRYQQSEVDKLSKTKQYQQSEVEKVTADVAELSFPNATAISHPLSEGDSPWALPLLPARPSEYNPVRTSHAMHASILSQYIRPHGMLGNQYTQRNGHDQMTTHNAVSAAALNSAHTPGAVGSAYPFSSPNSHNLSTAVGDAARSHENGDAVMQDMVLGIPNEQQPMHGHAATPTRRMPMFAMPADTSDDIV